MIKKFLFGLLLGLFGFISFSNAGSIVSNLGNSIDSNLNFSPNPLKLTTSDEGLNFYYGWNNGQIYFAVSNYNNGYIPGTKYGYPVFYYSGNNNPGDFYSALANGTFVPVSYSLNWGEFDDSKSELIFYDSGMNYFRSFCSFGKTNQGVVLISCQELAGLGHAYDSVSLDSSNLLPIGYSPYNNLNPDIDYDNGPGMGYGGIELGSDYSAINYYEKTYGWDYSICYVGIDNVTTLYGQNGVSFQKGGGLTIFETFNRLYGNQDLDKIYVWLNSRLINYENWFGVSGSPGMSSQVGNPSFLSHYNSGTNQADIYYDNLNFPFANNPVAIYFMANNIESQSPYSTMGSSVISYCNLKVNSGSFNEIIDDSDKININNYTEQSNINHGLNSDGTNKEYTGAWLSSGVNISFSGNTSIKNTLKNFFDQFDGLLSVADISTPNRILPSWIVSALLFVILFKFLRKR